MLYRSNGISQSDTRAVASLGMINWVRMADGMQNLYESTGREQSYGSRWGSERTISVCRSQILATRAHPGDGNHNHNP